MSSIKKIRESVDGRLDRWQARAEAMENQINSTRNQAMERVERSKQSYVEAIDKAKMAVEASAALAVDKKQRLQTKLDETRVQAALGKAETREAFERQSKAIRAAIRDVETSIDKEMETIDGKVDAGMEKVTGDLVHARNALDAELEATEQLFAEWKDKTSAKVAEVQQEVTSFKAKIAEMRGQAAENLDAFNEDFTGGWKQIVSSFKNLK